MLNEPRTAMHNNFVERNKQTAGRNAAEAQTKSSVKGKEKSAAAKNTKPLTADEKHIQDVQNKLINRVTKKEK